MHQDKSHCLFNNFWQKKNLKDCVVCTCHIRPHVAYENYLLTIYKHEIAMKGQNVITAEDITKKSPSEFKDIPKKCISEMF